MTKMEKLLALYQIQVQRLMTSQQEYECFIKFAAPLYKYSFSDAVLIFAQRPGATLVGEYEFWVNRLGLSLAGAKGIPVIHNKKGTNSLVYLFDVKDVQCEQWQQLPTPWSTGGIPTAQLVNIIDSDGSLLCDRIAERIRVLVNTATDEHIVSVMAQAANTLVRCRLAMDTHGQVLSLSFADNEALFISAHKTIFQAAREELNEVKTQISEWRNNNHEQADKRGTTQATGRDARWRGAGAGDAGAFRADVGAIYGGKLPDTGRKYGDGEQLQFGGFGKRRGSTELEGDNSGRAPSKSQDAGGLYETRTAQHPDYGDSGRAYQRADFSAVSIDSHASLIYNTERNISPLWHEYQKIKAETSGDIVFFQVGDFYEVFCEDAKRLAEEHGYSLASRTMGLPQSVEMVGIPKHTLNDVVGKLLDRGHTITVATVENGTRRPTRFIPRSKEAGFNHIDSQNILNKEPLVTGAATPTIAVAEDNFNIVDEHFAEGGAKAKYKRNIAAINTLKTIEHDSRRATAAEQEILSQYIGWGGIPQAFDSQNSVWAKEYLELKKILTTKEYAMARASTLNAHYTSPEVINAIYKAVGNLGFKDGKILEPAMGAGYFFGLMPESMKTSELFGVELDSLTGRIATQLYPSANIQIKGFQETTFTDGFFDMVIGNVPFGSYNISDDRYSMLIHDYFFVKSLDKLRTGGILAYITSKGTLDKENPEVRRMLAQRADLLGAIRLPNTAFKGIAGTEVTADIIFMQKRAVPPEEYPDWVYLGDYDVDSGIKVNQYYIDNPEMMLGTMAFGSHMYNGSGRDTTLLPVQNWLCRLDEAVEKISGQYITAIPQIKQTNEAHDLPLDYARGKRFSYQIIDGSVYYNDAVMLRLELFNQTKSERIKGMAEIRDTVRKIISIQLQEEYSEGALMAAQGILSAQYDSFVNKFGFLNSRVNQLAFQQDIDVALLSSLEESSGSGIYTKAAFFSKATVKRHETILSADNAPDALLISLNEKGRVDMEYMTALTGLEKEKLIDDLHGMIFRNHRNYDAEEYIGSEEYLSGDVRTKLMEAKAVAHLHLDLQMNVEALERVQPEWINASDIGVRLSSQWIGENIITQFMHKLLRTPFQYTAKASQRGICAHYRKISNDWIISNKSQHSSVLTASTYGTERISAYNIIEQMLNQREITIRDPYDDNGQTKYRYNHEQTILARQKQEVIEQNFRDWVFSDQRRREELEEKYNLIFNRVRPREYDGSFITLPDTNPMIELRSHQKNGIARIRSGGNTLLAHVVGAGKTFTMVAGGMELLRLGYAKKLLYVVPNHIIGDFAGDFLRLYPTANILIPNDRDFQKANRQRFIAKIATADINAIIIGHSQFEKLDISPERKAMEIQKEIEALEHALSSAKHDDAPHYTVKQLEKSKMALTEKMNKLLSDKNKDGMLYFEELGIDRIFIDEAHNYKNGAINSKMNNVSGVQSASSLKASDLLAKVRYINEIGGSVIFATGTPISNSICEMYVMQRYLQEDALNKREIYHFDEWASDYGETVTSIELRPEGGGYRTNTRFSRFFNLPELMQMFREVVDIQTADMLDLPKPALHGGKATVIACEPSEDLLMFMDNCIVRAAAIRDGLVESTVDNMLKMTSEARKAGTDMRLLDPESGFDFDGKLYKCAKMIAGHYTESMDSRGTQLVFSDIGTPNAAKFNIYDELRRLLIAEGVPADEIAFIHDAKTDRQKEQLFGDMRCGEKRVLIGSTAKCGAGTNIQERLIALHHLDCPWRPSDIEQREGRILRQGNSNKEVFIYRYVTKKSFDSYLWQLVEQKQRFISQVMSGKDVGRSCKDIDDAVLSFAEVKAIASGDPRIKERMELDMEVEKLLLLKKQYNKQIYHLQEALSNTYPNRRATLLKGLEEVSADLITTRQYTVDSFEMKIDGMRFTERSKAAEAFLSKCTAIAPKYGEHISIGEIKGLTISISNSMEGKVIRLEGKHIYTTSMGESGMGNITRIENKLDDLMEMHSSFSEQLDRIEENIAEAQVQLKAPFDKNAELIEKQQRLIAITAEIDVSVGKVQEDTSKYLPEAEPALQM